jgi:hypothetical protein
VGLIYLGPIGVDSAVAEPNSCSNLEANSCLSSSTCLKDFHFHLIWEFVNSSKDAPCYFAGSLGIIAGAEDFGRTIVAAVESWGHPCNSGIRFGSCSDCFGRRSFHLHDRHIHFGSKDLTHTRRRGNVGWEVCFQTCLFADGIKRGIGRPTSSLDPERLRLGFAAETGQEGRHKVAAGWRSLQGSGSAAGASSAAAAGGAGSAPA